MSDGDDASDWSRGFAATAAGSLRTYDEILVPAMFGPWAERLLDAVEPVGDEHLLDVACGPGTVARRAAPRLGDGGRVVACDLSPGMLEVARSAEPAAGPAVEYVESPAAPLAVDDDSFDVVVCQQGLQFFPDRLAALGEMRRAARAGARVGLAVWASIDRCPPFDGLGRALHDALGAELAASYRGGPWGLSDPDELQRLASEAGFTAVEVTAVELPVTFPGGVDDLLASVVTSPIGPEIAAAGADAHRELADAAQRHLAPLVDEGAVVSSMTAHLVTARS